MEATALLPVDLIEKYRSMPPVEGLCLPTALLQRACGLRQLIDYQIKFSKQSELGQQAATCAGQAALFSCYQLVSHVLALQCWYLWQADCVKQQAIIVDNLTGLIVPGAQRRHYAEAIKNSLFSVTRHWQMALKIYRLTSALLHSYAHLHQPGKSLCFPYRELDGKWRKLGPWKLSALIKNIDQWLETVGNPPIAQA